MSELHDVDRRLAVLEQIAQDTATALSDIRAELRLLRTDIGGLRSDMRAEMQALRSDMQGRHSDTQRQMDGLRSDFRWLLRLMIGGFVGTWALLAHGLHWF